ncbi:hypothetical protein NJG17_10180 [Stenotrophomonas maltophilia]|uniref:hypothetical protein n=1 Tax=Stenotrophomonas maltophilia TaxID=40324 RepID=UPI00209AFE06|nr:hypothetical protein [Stenotrophomonas maltophilia]MCO7500266.1 hypothetical protein [Stenotrophomonas maltophilia]
MSNVSFRIDQRGGYEVGDSPSVFARISLLDDLGRTVRDETLNELVPISSREQDVLLLDLPPGVYAIEARLPTGELLAESVVVHEGVESSVVLHARSVSDEWLGAELLPDSSDWRRLLKAPSQTALAQREATYPDVSPGRFVARKSTKSRSSSGVKTPKDPTPRSTRDEKAAPAQAMLEMPRTAVSYEISRPYWKLDPGEANRDLLGRIGLDLSGRKIRGFESQRQPAVWRLGEPAKVNPLRSIHLFECSEYSYEPDFLQSNPWETLPNLMGSTANILAGLRLGARRQVIRPVAGDESRADFELEVSSVEADSARRSFAAVPRRMGVELICLPTNFEGIGSGRFADLALAVRMPRYEHEFSTSVFVRDRKMATLLAFLSSGDLSTVNQLAAHSSLMLFEKNTDPVAAAAGGYALVGSVVDNRSQSWHAWIENLMRHFKMPDGAIQYGMMRLRLRTSRSDVSAAAEAFKRAYRQGLPIFGMGMRWLLDGLEQTALIDDEAKEMAAAVRRLSFRLHPQSPFTILRLGKR